MDESGIDESTQAVLRSAGWFPGRVVDVPSYIDLWAARGILANSAAENFCRQFAGLEITHPPHVSIGGRDHSDFTNLDPAEAIEGISDRALEEFSRIAGEPLCPVGTNRSHMTVLVGPSGRVLAGVDNYLFELGADSTEALNWICAGKPLRLIGTWFPAPTDP